MSEPLARARRVVTVGAAALVVVIVALAAAAWRLVDEETESAAMRGRSAAAFAVEDLVRALGTAVGTHSGPKVVLSRDGALKSPTPPRRFRPLPTLGDAEGAFLIRESETWGDSLRRAALLRAAESKDAATRLAAASAGMRLDLRAHGPFHHELGVWRGAANRMTSFDDGPLEESQESILVRLQPTRWESVIDGMTFGAPDASAALAVVGSEDDLAAASMVASLHPDGARLVRERRAELAEARALKAAWTTAREVDAEFRVAVFPDGSAAASRCFGAEWDVVRLTEQEVRATADRVLAPRGMALVSGDAAARTSAAPLSTDGRWAVDASFSGADTQSRSTLLLSGLGVAAGAAVLAFVAFARSARREARLAALRTDFVATVSHELRTPVAVVRTSAETLASGRATRDEDKQALTEAIVRESERLSSLVGNVLDFARMESGRRTYAMHATDLGALVRDVAARHANVSVDVAADVPRLNCDADALGAAVSNLLDNARKFSGPTAPVAVHVVLHGDEVAVEVEDHGIGVPDAEKPHVFERFFRGADPRVRDTRGAGIGLALVEHAAHAHGGRVEIVDTPGGGATFRIALPIAQNG